MLRKEILFNKVPVVAAAVVPLVVYLWLLAPGVTLEDSGELTAAALTLGIPHPPGYPVWVVLAHAWAALTGGTAWSINFFSTVCLAGAAALVYLIVRRLSQPRVLALAAAWLFAFYPAVVAQAVVAEVYGLHALLFCLGLYLALRLAQGGRPWLTLALAFVLGLGSANHQLMIFAVPVLVIYIFWQRPGLGKQLWFGALLCFLLALGFYLYLPWRALQQPLINWGNPSTWQAFWDHVLRRNYADLGGVPALGAVGRFGFVRAFMTDLVQGLSWLVVVTGGLGVGLAWLRKQSRLELGLLTALAAGQVLPAIYLRSHGWGLGLEFTYQVYWCGAVAAVVMLLVVGWGALFDFSRARFGGAPTTQLVLGTLLLLTMLPWGPWYGSVVVANHRGDDFPGKHAAALLEQLPMNAVLYVGGHDYAGDSELFTLAEAQLVRKVRPDVLIIDGGLLFPLPPELARRVVLNPPPIPPTILTEQWLRALWQFTLEHQRWLYITSLPLGNGSFLGVPDGLAYRVLVAPVAGQALDIRPSLLPPDMFSVERLAAYSGQDYLAHLLYHQAASLLWLGRGATAQAALLQAIALDNEPFSEDYQAYIAYRELWNHR